MKKLLVMFFLGSSNSLMPSDHRQQAKSFTEAAVKKEDVKKYQLTNSAFFCRARKKKTTIDSSILNPFRGSILK